MPIKHPDYDIDFKPAIALFDWDQTHDVCYFYHKVEIPNDQCPLIDEQIVAIDRFTTDNVAWCDKWADLYFELNKYFNYCPYNYVNEDFEVTNKFDPSADYSVTLDKGKWEITCLQREKKALFIHDYPYLVTCYSRHKKTFNIADSQDINLSRYFNKIIKWRIPQYYHVISKELTVTGQLPITSNIYDYYGENIEIDENGNFTFNASDNGIYRIIYCHHDEDKNSYYDTLIITIDQDEITGIPDTNIKITEDSNSYSGNLNIPNDPVTNQQRQIVAFSVNGIYYLPNSIAFFNGFRLQIKKNGSFSLIRDENKNQTLPIIYYMILNNDNGNYHQNCFVFNINKTFIENSFTPNSMVFVKDGAIRNPTLSDNFFLYEDITEYFNQTIKTEIETYLNDKTKYPENEHIELGKFAKEYKQDFDDINTSKPLEITYESFPQSMRDHCALVRANNNYWNNQTPLNDLGVSIPSFTLTTILNQDFTQFNDFKTWFLGSSWATLYALSKNKTFTQILSNANSIGYSENILFNFNHSWRGFNMNPDSFLLNKSVFVPAFSRLYMGNLFRKKPSVFNFSNIIIGTRTDSSQVLDKWDRETAINLGCKKIIYTYKNNFYSSYPPDNPITYDNPRQVSEYTFYFDLISDDPDPAKNSYRIIEYPLDDYSIKLEYEWFTDQEFKDLFTYFKDNYLLSDEDAKNWIKDNVESEDLLKKYRKTIVTQNLNLYNGPIGYA